MDGPPDSRLFVVCGRATEAELLQSAFSPFGNVQNVKVIREKGVAYVKYDRASAAALAIENLNGAVLNQGRGPKLKVLLAETPTPRGAMMPVKMLLPEQELSSDPDNVPLRSRLFIVVPKQAEPQQIQDDMALFPDLEYCKTDLIASKGVVFCKFNKASSALRTMEEVAARGGVAGYKVKCMLAEPKTKRGRPDGAPQDMFSVMQQHSGKLDYAFGMQGMPMDGMYSQKLPGGMNRNHALGMDTYGGIPGLALNGGPLGGFGSLQGVSMAHITGMDGLGGQVGLGLSGNGLHIGSIHTGGSSGVSPSQSPHAVSRQRLFVVVHKAVAEEMVARLFRRFPGMEYCDLKKDRTTGKSKGYAYVNYSTPDAANAAVEQLNGVEFPHQSGHRIKVMFAEPLGIRPPHSTSPHGRTSPPGTIQVASPSPVHTPCLVGGRPLAADVAAVSESLASLSLPQSNSSGALELVDDGARRMASPAANAARELMFVG